jgi:hypothetical protein
MTKLLDLLIAVLIYGKLSNCGWECPAQKYCKIEDGEKWLNWKKCKPALLSWLFNMS